MMGPGFPYMDPSYMGWMTFGSLLFWTGLVAIAIFAIVRLTRPVERGRDAGAILDERLARGEIDADEYRSRRSLLTSR